MEATEDHSEYDVNEREKVIMERVFIISGPSGVGKGTLIQMLMDEFGRDVFLSVSVTTREQRPGETAGVSYDYISSEAYAQLLKNGDLLEHAEYAGGCYGSRRRALEALKDHRSVIFEVDVQGKDQIIREITDAVTIFIAPPSMEELRRRLKERGTETPEKIALRLKHAESEISAAEDYQYRIVNANICDAYKQLRTIYEAESRRV